MTTELYQVELRGNDVVFRALQQMDQEARKAAESFSRTSKPSIDAATTFSARANGLADAFKMVSRDIGTLGGQSAQVFTHMADEALSIIGVLSSGAGIPAAIAGIGIAVGGLSALLSSAETERAKAHEQAVKAEEEEQRAVLETARAILEKRKGYTEEQIALREIQEDLTRKSMLERADLIGRLTLYKEEAKARGDNEEFTQAAVRLREEQEAQAEDARELRAREAETRAAKNKLLTQEALEGELEWQSVLVESGSKAAQTKEQEQKRAEARAEAAAQAGMSFDARMAAEERAREEAQFAAAVQQASAEQQLDDDESARLRQMEEEDRARFAAEQERDASRLSAIQAQDAAARTALANQAIATAELRQEQELQERAAKMATAAQIGQAVVMTAATPVVAELTGQVHELAMANRETYRDLIFFSKEFPALIAAKAQAVLAGIAAEATGRAAMEGAEALAMLALGLGYMAVPGMQGFAAPAFASAAQHGAAAAAFAALGGGALGGAMLIGSQRGEGGLVSLTSAERDDLDRKRGVTSDRGGGGVSGGSAFSGGERFGSGRGQTIVNIYNEPGSIAGQDQERAAAEVARHVQRAQRDWFTRYEMEH